MEWPYGALGVLQDEWPYGALGVLQDEWPYGALKILREFQLNPSVLEENTSEIECIDREFQWSRMTWKRISIKPSDLEENTSEAECVDREFQWIRMTLKRIPMKPSVLEESVTWVLWSKPDFCIAFIWSFEFWMNISCVRSWSATWTMKIIGWTHASLWVLKTLLEARDVTAVIIAKCHVA